MQSRQFTATGLVAAIAALGLGTAVASAGTVHPVSQHSSSYIQTVDCAVGAHIGPAGVCIIGSDPPPVVVAQPAQPVVVAPAPVAPDAVAAPPVGCASKSVTATDGSGASETRTQTQC